MTHAVAVGLATRVRGVTLHLTAHGLTYRPLLGAAQAGDAKACPTRPHLKTAKGLVAPVGRPPAVVFSVEMGGRGRVPTPHGEGLRHLLRRPAKVLRFFY